MKVWTYWGRYNLWGIDRKSYEGGPNISIHIGRLSIYFRW